MTVTADPCIAVVHGQYAGSDHLAVLIKRSYRVGPGLAPSLHDEQLPLHDAIVLAEAEPPRVPAPLWDNDHFAFKTATDLVVQGSAQAAHGGDRSVEVGVVWRGGERRLRVHGERRLERGPGGSLRFSEAAPFERMRLGYDRAFGGCDHAALAEAGDPVGKLYAFLRPEWELGACTPFHYPRNPAGVGYCCRMPTDPEAVTVPNCEYLDDPLTPERMVVDGPRGWMTAPLPAGMDWYEQSWFPRSACLGVIPEHAVGAEPRECALGWAQPDLMTLGSIFDMEQLPAAFVQGASPGMQIAEPPPGDRLRLDRLWPGHPQAVLTLPDERPRVSLELPGGKHAKCKTSLSSLVLQPDAERAVLVWSCRTPVVHRYTPDQLAAMRRAIAWGR